MLGKRARISFSQLISLQPKDEIATLFEKHGIIHDPEVFVAHQSMQYVTQAFTGARPEQIVEVLAEVVRLRDVHRFNVSPRYLHDQRWNDLETCLLLEG